MNINGYICTQNELPFCSGLVRKLLRTAKICIKSECRKKNNQKFIFYANKKKIHLSPKWFSSGYMQ